MRFPLPFLVLLVASCGGTVAPSTPADGSVADASVTTDSIVTDTPLADIFVPAVDVGFPKECTMAGMCLYVPASCCGSCGMATRTDGIAVPRDKASEYRMKACSSDAGGFACPDCAGIPDPNLHAFCRGGACEPVVVTSDVVSACTTDADCQLAMGVCCGPCLGEASLVAVAKSKASEFSSQICDPRADCAGCPVPSPTKAIATCDPTTKHCVVVK